jgi:hypothetical protein
LIIYQVVGGRFTNGEHVIDEPSHAEAVQLVVEELHAQLAWNEGSNTLLLRPTLTCPWAILDLLGHVLLAINVPVSGKDMFCASSKFRRVLFSAIPLNYFVILHPI